MYVWCVGMVFSKLALRRSLVACQPRIAVSSRHTATMNTRWLNSARSTSDPDRGSNAADRSGVGGFDVIGQAGPRASRLGRTVRGRACDPAEARNSTAAERRYSMA